ncbi:hypothetical protein Droror1_Dr00006708 [Drosera rotundifolia]
MEAEIQSMRKEKLVADIRFTKALVTMEEKNKVENAEEYVGMLVEKETVVDEADRKAVKVAAAEANAETLNKEMDQERKGAKDTSLSFPRRL